MNSQPIGIFDSGLGGISVLQECQKLLPNESFLYYGDSAYAPYGTQSNDYVINRCIHICDNFIDQNVKAIVIACNTATSVAINTLRERYQIPIIGMEPALKLAASYKDDQTILVMATSLTLQEHKFNILLHQYDENHTVLKAPCPKFVEIIEYNQVHNRQTLVNEQLNELKHIWEGKTIDSIVLGCTHFVFLKKEITNYFGSKIRLVDGNEGTAKNLKNILETHNIASTGPSNILMDNSNKQLIKLEETLLATKKEYL